MTLKVELVPYKMFPYEERFALDEIRKYIGEITSFQDREVVVKADRAWKKHYGKLTYVTSIEDLMGDEYIPDQQKIERLATTSAKKVTKRQNTRYGGHGLHEYKGKFNPQVVRAIGNALGLKKNDWVLDPFCGSGTTLLESGYCGWNAVGSDLNPMAIMISNAKLAALHISAADLEKNRKSIIKKLEKTFSNFSFDRPFSTQKMKSISVETTNLDEDSLIYLQKWFAPSILAQLLYIKALLGSGTAKMKLIFEVILSDLIREVSLQDPGDLRIRRRSDPFENYPVYSLFIKNLNDKTAHIIDSSNLMKAKNKTHETFVGSCCNKDTYTSGALSLSNDRLFDAAITSPPYATALPYIDTQRLSLIFFGLISSTEVLRLEKSLTGSREVNKKERESLELMIRENSIGFPVETISLLLKLVKLYDPKTDGFRKQNVPALLFRYFSEMYEMFSNVHKLIKKNGCYALVVGVNQTFVGSQKTIIDTPTHLALLAKQVGFSVIDILPMETYARYGLHSKNSINAEKLIILKKN